MIPYHTMKKLYATICILLCTLLLIFILQKHVTVAENTGATSTPTKNVLYTGNIYHIFFHSLIVYPEKAFSDKKRSEGYKTWMITRDEFTKILPELYKNNFVLIDISSVYEVDANGTVHKKKLYIPEGKKPLIISLDDLSYYSTLEGHGFARKLVLDSQGKVATEIINDRGVIEVTRDGDVVPILDDFVSQHPDFSVDGAKGIIAVTGYEGILGYRTQNAKSQTYTADIQAVKKVVSKLKSTGWRFASHSYSHDTSYTKGTVSLEKVKKDAELWNAEVKPLVGDTDIFIGPFGQIFKHGDARQAYLKSIGFNVFCGVGMDVYLRYYDDVLIMNRADIDGYRLAHPVHLKTYFDAKKVIDPYKNKLK